MKYIEKYPEPQELLDWKENDKMYKRGHPNWDRIPSGVKQTVRETLLAEQGYICCYCERIIQEGDCHIEHIKPKGAPEYEHFLAEYDNLLCSCQFELAKGEPKHCARRKGNWYDEELFISPLQPNCETRFKYTHDGHIYATIENDKAANCTIENLHLKLDKLNALRRAAIEPFLDETLSQDELNAFVNGYLADKIHNNGKYNPFYTTIKYLFSSQ